MYANWLATKVCRITIDNAPNPDIIIVGRITNVWDSMRVIEVDGNSLYNVDNIKSVTVEP